MPVVFSSPNSALPFIQSDVVRALGVATEQRSPLLADVPIFQEIGIIGVKSDTWFGLAGPAAMPRQIVDQIASLSAGVMGDVAARNKLAALGAEPLNLGPDASRQRMNSELAAFAELAATMGICPDYQ